MDIITNLMQRPLIFLQPTTAFRELILLDEIEKDSRITQSKLAKQAKIVPAMVNNYIKEFIKNGYISVEGNNRDMRYSLTLEGKRHKFNLLISYFQEAVSLYKSIKEETKGKLATMVLEGISKIVLYGAAETGEIMLTAAEELNLKVVGIVDGNETKQGQQFFGHEIKSPDLIESLNPDAIIISSSGYQDQLYEALKDFEEKGIKVRKL